MRSLHGSSSQADRPVTIDRHGARVVVGVSTTIWTAAAVEAAALKAGLVAFVGRVTATAPIALAWPADANLDECFAAAAAAGAG